MNELTQERLKELLHYNPETGSFIWKNSLGTKMNPGDVAGSIKKSGYIHIGISKKYYRAHRLAWLYMHGVWPKHQIDHIDGNRKNNRINNLRDVTNSVNQQNLKKARNCNKTGVLGVTVVGRKFQATIKINGIDKYIGLFPSKELAYDAYLGAKRKLHEGCTI